MGSKSKKGKQTHAPLSFAQMVAQEQIKRLIPTVESSIKAQLDPVAKALVRETRQSLHAMKLEVKAVTKLLQEKFSMSKEEIDDRFLLELEADSGYKRTSDPVGEKSIIRVRVWQKMVGEEAVQSDDELFYNIGNIKEFDNYLIGKKEGEEVEFETASPDASDKRISVKMKVLKVYE